MDKQTWKIMSVIRDLITKHDGMIFGGYVRDMILHDHNAARFYDETQDDAYAVQKYDDISYHPQTADRVVVPRDIDCMFDVTHFTAFKNDMKAARFIIKTCKVLNPVHYFPNFVQPQGNNIYLHKLVVKHDIAPILREAKRLAGDMTSLGTLIRSHLLLQPKICMDVLVTDSPMKHPFVSTLHFECNGLYMTKHGVHVAPELCASQYPLNQHMKLAGIIDDIIARKAVFKGVKTTNDSPAKLVRRGWTVCDRYISTVCDAHYEGHCIICHDQVPEIHMKLHCCDARYHIGCLMKYIETTIENKGGVHECIMCKAHCNLTMIHTYLLWSIENT